MTNSLRDEAVTCRREARRFAGKPEEPFLLRLSQAFEDLARQQGNVHPSEAYALADLAQERRR